MRTIAKALSKLSLRSTASRSATDATLMAAIDPWERQIKASNCSKSTDVEGKFGSATILSRTIFPALTQKLPDNGPSTGSKAAGHRSMKPEASAKMFFTRSLNCRSSMAFTARSSAENFATSLLSSVQGTPSPIPFRCPIACFNTSNMETASARVKCRWNVSRWYSSDSSNVFKEASLVAPLSMSKTASRSGYCGFLSQGFSFSSAPAEDRTIPIPAIRLSAARSLNG